MILVYCSGHCLGPCSVGFEKRLPLCRAEERGTPEHVFSALTPLSHSFFFFFLLRCTTRCRLGIHVYIVFLCVRTCKIAHPFSCSKRCVDRFAKARHSTFYFPKPLCSCSLSVFIFLPAPIFCPCSSLRSSLLLLFTSKCVKIFFLF